MTALLLSLCASLAWGVSDFGGGAAARRFSTLVVLAWMRSGGVLLIGALALLTSAPWIGDRWPFALAAGATTLAGSVALLRALAIGPMGIAAPIVAASAAVPAVAGLLDGSALGVATLAGLAVTAAGAVLASSAPGRDGERASATGVGYALAAAGLLGATLLLIHEASAASALTAVAFERACEVPCLVAAVALGRTRRAGPTAVGRAQLIALGTVEGTAVAAYAAASTHGPLTLAAILSSLYPVVTVLLARALHGERLSRAQLTGAALTLAGVIGVVASGP